MEMFKEPAPIRTSEIAGFEAQYRTEINNIRKNFPDGAVKIYSDAFLIWDRNAEYAIHSYKIERNQQDVTDSVTREFRDQIHAMIKKDYEKIQNNAFVKPNNLILVLAKDRKK